MTLLVPACTARATEPGASSAGPAGAPEASAGTAGRSASFVIATFNIHYVSLRDGLEWWEERREAVREAVEELDADLLAFQEMETFGGGSFSERNVQLDFLLDRFPEYRAAAVGDPRTYPSTQPILYRPTRFQPLEQGYFFYSSAPDEIYSRSWDGRFPAFTSWVRFRDQASGATFMVYNNHFDAGSASNRTKSARLVSERLASRPYPDDAVIVLGDFNAPRFFPAMRTLARAGLHRAPVAGPTFHFRRGLGVLPAIDHVLGSEQIEFRDASRLRARYDDHYPSDHYPVRVRVTIGPAAARIPEERDDSM